MQARDQALLIRLTEEEKDILRRKLAKTGITMSDYVRMAAIHSDDASVRVVDVDPLQRIIFELIKQGANLSQLIKFLNAHGVDASDVKEAERVFDFETKLFSETAEVLVALRNGAERGDVLIGNGGFDNPDADSQP